MSSVIEYKEGKALLLECELEESQKKEASCKRELDRQLEINRVLKDQHQRELDQKESTIENLKEDLVRYQRIFERGSDPTWQQNKFPSCFKSSQLIASGKVLPVSQQFIESVNLCFDNGSRDWLDFYLDQLAPSEEPDTEQIEAISKNLDRVQKFQQLILSHEGNSEELKEILGLSKLEEIVGVRSVPVEVKLKVEPRILPNVGEIIVIRREEAGEEASLRANLKTEQD